VSLSSPLFVRMAARSDLEGLARLELDAWGHRAAPLAQLQRRLEEPGFETVIVSRGDEIIAFAQAARLTLESLALKSTWTDMAAGRPNPGGTLLYGINLSARTGPAASGAGRVALDALLALVVHRQLVMFVAGGRLPGFRAWSHCCSAAVYARLHAIGDEIYHVDADGVVRLVGGRSLANLAERIATPASWSFLPERKEQRVRLECEPVDPFVRMLSAARCCGLGVQLVGILPDYYMDPESLDNGLLYAWTNPFVVADRKLTLQEMSVRVASGRMFYPI